MRDRRTSSYSIFVGIYVYCLLVLRTIRGGENEFVPGVSVVGAIVLALVGMAFLIFFIHHIATSIQVSEIAARIGRETIGAADALFARDARGQGSSAQPLHDADERWSAVAADSTGYIQFVDYERLMAHARSTGTVVRTIGVAGDFVVRARRC